MIIRSTARNWDPGLFDIAFLGEDANKTHKTLLKADNFSSDIGFYEILAYKEMKLREILAKAPDGVAVAFLQL